MIYEVNARLFFTKEDEANDFYHDCQLAFEKSDVVNPGAPNEEPGQISLIECHHDENPNTACFATASMTKASPAP